MIRGKIVKIENNPATRYFQGGLILTVELYNPIDLSAPGNHLGGDADPHWLQTQHTRYLNEMRKIHGFHVGWVDLNMPDVLEEI